MPYGYESALYGFSGQNETSRRVLRPDAMDMR